ncbi:MAG: hypothetical protein ABW047_16310 [Nitrospiraceae bacterium]
MGTTTRQIMMEQLFDLEKTIAQLNVRVGQLQKSLRQGPSVSADRPTMTRSSLRRLFGGWKSTGMSSAMVRENRRVERHATALF